MMKKELQSLDIDVKKMPLGKLTQNQIRQGYNVLSQIETILNNPYLSRSISLFSLVSYIFFLIFIICFHVKFHLFFHL